MSRAALILLLFVSLGQAKDLNVNVSGESREKADLETLSPKPLIPNADEMTFSLDGGKSAVENEVVPLPVSVAALDSDLSQYQIPVLPVIPEAPFVTQPVPNPESPTLNNLRPFGRQQREKPAVAEWQFSIVDERNFEQFGSSGTGFPSGPFVWDGTRDGKLVMIPDRSYFPFLVLKSSTGVTLRIPGEAERYLGFARREGPDEIIDFGDRLYERGRSSFSPEGDLYLRDVRHRLSLMDPRQTFTVKIYCPRDKEELAQSRKKAWIGYLEKNLERRMNPDRFKVIPADIEAWLTEITLYNFTDPNRAIMTGKSRDLRPGLEDINKWIEVKDDGKQVIVEMRHDRLFRAGSAYIRDQALPVLVRSLAQVRAVNQGKPKAERRTILLRSYMERPRILGRNRTFEEDPQLAALRSKVLFMLFAEENYLR